MNIINRYIKNALGSRYGRSRVSVKSATGTARGWTEIIVQVPKPPDCYCEKGNALCRMCVDTRQNATDEARKITYAAQEKSGEKFSTYCNDEGETRECVTLQVYVIEKNE